MHRVFPFPFRSLLLFTTLRLDAVVPVPSTISTCVSSVRSLSLSSGLGFGFGPASRDINWTALVKGNCIAWNTHSRIPIAQFTQTRSAKMSTSSKDVEEVIDRATEPVSKQEEILGENEGREEASKVVEMEEKKIEKKEEKKEEALPKLSAADFKIYNSMAEHMNYFHNHFRQTWTLLKTATTNNQRPRDLSLRQFLQTGLSFLSQLEVHHGIEEQHIFPVLARKMPEFANGKNAAELLRQHREIHKGMDVMQEYLEKCRDGETELSLKVLGEKMDGFGEVLWKHLDQEVETLGAENMRRYWSREEMRRMPM
ncbi:putative neutrophil cytosol factor 2 protein [Botrytis fragariae]|uniref:Putative neutrophil cytosol factor 2 protein n=1 Tax=Botrytis fragariae TaxID=1964551 RepID=A0A8H6EPA9_9HELO|nr:putative neutrophil cytosol factor 2 protein [Botrytis fragariae]KAF5879706.1 putative neutrophil cytosol factor 2 protein [Botrytis fragariae]